MATDHGSDYAKRVLEGLGMRVEKVPETELKTADLLAWDSEERYCIECKQKAHDTEWFKLMDERTSAGEVVHYSDPYGARNSIAKRIREASRQIEATIVGNDSIFRCVWFQVVGHDKDLRWEQVICTFFGASHARTIETDRSLFAFYVDHSSAFACKEIDAIFLTDGSDLSILLNEFSPRYTSLKVSHICERLGEGVLDPQAYVSEGRAIALRGDVQRENEEAVEAALAEQEGERVILIRMKRHSAYSAVANPKND